MGNVTTVYIVRHGQTEWNVEKRWQGHQDSPLTDLGIRQAQWLAEALQAEKIDFIYSSTSPRAARTAAIIRGNRNLSIEETDALLEINLGIWEGNTIAECESSDPQQYDNFWNNPELFYVPQGERFEEVATRALQKLNELLINHKGKSILLVTHTIVVKLLMANFEGRALQQLWQLPYIEPACLCKVEITETGTHIVLHGDISHYKEKPTRT